MTQNLRTALSRGTAFLTVLGVALPAAAQDGPGYEMYRDIYDPGAHLFEYDAFRDWTMHLDTTLSFEAYGLSDNRALGPYQDTGTHAYLEFNVVGSREFSQFRRMRVQVAGVWNHSNYRHTKTALIPERINFLHENGEVDLPYRLELGNFYGDFTPRTLQASLKGGILEVQPQQSLSGELHSIQVIAASGVTRWDRDNFDDDVYAGASWLIDATQVGASGMNLGTWTLNYIHNWRPQQAVEGFPEVRDQDTLSIAGERAFRLPLDQVWTVEGEYATMRGDHELTGNLGEDQEQYGQATFLQVTGYDEQLPLDYRFRYENYQDDFGTAGANNITADFQGVESQVGWRFERGLRMRLRDTRYRTNRDTGNQTQTVTDGITFTGPLFAYFEPDSPITGSLDIYRRRSADAQNAALNNLRVIDLDINTPLPDGWTGRFGLKLQDDHDIDAGSERVSKELSASADHAVAWRGWSGTVTPGLILRTADGQDVDNTDIQPSVGLNVGRGRHSLASNFGIFYQNARDPGDVNTVDVTFSGVYAYTHGPHVFSLEGDYLNRDLDATGNTDQLRLALLWRYNYDKPAGATATDAASPLPFGQDRAGLRIGRMPPGLGLADVEALLAEQGLGDAARQPNAALYEARLFEDIPLRQRIVVVEGNGAVATSGAIIEFEDTTNPIDMQRAYARVLSELLARYGSPTESYEDGPFTATLATDLADGTFRRIIEWPQANGIIRFGIPRRLDNQVRMEVLYAPSFPARSQSVWGLTQIR